MLAGRLFWHHPLGLCRSASHPHVEFAIPDQVQTIWETNPIFGSLAKVWRRLGRGIFKSGALKLAGWMPAGADFCQKQMGNRDYPFHLHHDLGWNSLWRTAGSYFWMNATTSRARQGAPAKRFRFSIWQCARIWYFAVSALLSGHLFAEDALPAASAEDEMSEAAQGQWKWNAVPRFSFSNDEGVGLGVRGIAYWHRWNSRPYKTAISFQAFATSRWVQQHYLRVDALDAFSYPLRISAEVGYYQSRTYTYCGVGGNADCTPSIGPNAGFTSIDQEAFDSRYNQVRFLQPYGNTTLRWRLGDKPHRPELIAAWRGHFQQPGEFADEDEDGAADFFPYPSSRYALAHPDGERGTVSLFQVGASLDNRDEEPDPSRGYLLEASVRGAHSLWGSDWTHMGFHATSRLFVPLLPNKRLVWASRYVIDWIIGDAPLTELSRVGGFTDYFAYGGADMGRGIRQQRFPGRQKWLMQHELRSRWGGIQALEQDFQFSTAVFADTGWVLADHPFDGEKWRLHLGGGAGLRIVWNQNFVMRIDFGLSPVEDGQPYLYTKPDHPF